MTTQLKQFAGSRKSPYGLIALLLVTLILPNFIKDSYAEGFKFFSKSRSGALIFTTSIYPSYEDISGLSSIQVNPDQEKGYFIILNAPDTWNSNASAGVRFAINIDGQIVADGVYTNTSAGQQQIPITIVTVHGLSAGSHVIKGQWCVQDGGVGYLGEVSDTTLVVVEIPPGVEAYMSSRSGELNYTDSFYPSYEDISDLSSIQVSPDQEKDYLVILNAPDSWNVIPGVGVRFAINIDGQVVADGVYTNTSAGQQEIPITIVTLQRLSAGTHVIKGQWCTQDGGAGYLGGISETTLSVVEIPAEVKAVMSSRAGSVNYTDSKYPSYEDINDLSSIEVNPDREKDYLIILNAPDTWNSVNSVGVRFAIDIDGEVVADGVCTNTSAGMQSLPITIVTVQRLSAGTHIIKGQWSVQDGGAGFLGGIAKTNLIVVEAAANITETPGCPGSIAIDLTLNQTKFQPGNTFNADLHITNTSTPRNIDIKIWFEVPGLGLISYLKYADFSLTGCLDYSLKDFIRISLPKDLPIGSYKIGGRLLNSITGEEISKDIETFTFSSSE